MNNIKQLDCEKIIGEMAENGDKVTIICCYNYEDRSIAFAEKLYKAYREEGNANLINLVLWRLTPNDRPNLYSLLEEKKRILGKRLKELDERFVNSEDIIWNALDSVDCEFIRRKLVDLADGERNLIVDLSTMPSKILFEFSKMIAEFNFCEYYRKVFIVYTKAVKYYGRKSIGTSQAGGLNLKKIEPSALRKCYALIFPGCEGYEAALAVSILRSRWLSTDITVAINFYEPNLCEAMNIGYANQLICTGTINDINKIYYYSDQDIQRVLEKFYNKVVSSCVEDKKLVEFAVFDINWRVIYIAFTAVKFEYNRIETHLITFGKDEGERTHQYHNFYSEGVGEMTMLQIDRFKNEVQIREEKQTKNKRLRDLFNFCDAVIFDADDTLWLDNIYYKEFRDTVFEIIKNEHPELSRFYLKKLLKIKRQDRAGEIGYVQAAKDLAEELNISPDGQRKIMQSSDYFLTRRREPLKGVKELLQFLKRTHKCYIVTQNSEEAFDKKLESAQLDYEFEKIYCVDKKNKQTWKEIHSCLTEEGNEPLYIGNSFSLDIIPNVELGHNVIWFNGDKKETKPSELLDVLEVTSWTEISEVLIKDN